ncbi:MAG: nucleotide-binding universal stress UspA family protein [Bacteroidia bacterium]|jgi:nucleotide-binding universal stress UspA family protein
MPSNLKQIIAAYVPSKASNIALSLANALAKNYEARLTVINVNPDKTEPDLVQKEIASVMGKGNSAFGFVEKLGKPYKEILNLENALNADLIVMGSHGSKERDPEWIGGNAFKVLSGSTCPVLVLPEDFHGNGFSTIVLPISESSETRQKVTLSVDIAKKFGAKIHILVVNKDEDPQVLYRLKIYGDQVQKYCESQEVDFIREEIYNENIANACADYAKAVNADLICIMSERESPTGFFLGHYAQQLLNEADTPVLTIHAKDFQLVGEAGY